MTPAPSPTLTPPRLAPGVQRGDGSPPAAESAGTGIEPAAVDCSRLHGVARQICYQTQPHQFGTLPSAAGLRKSR